MTYVAPADAYAAAPLSPRRLQAVETLRLGLLWFTGLAGAFVFMEPSPYEVASLLTIILFAASGLALRADIMPLALLLILYNIGFGIAVVPVLAVPKALTWVLVSCYLGTTALFFAAMLGSNTEARLRMLMRGYTAAAVVAALAGTLGYFGLLPGLSEFVLLYDRARGTFNDPNVLGAFLTLPALVAFQHMLAGRFADVLRNGLLLLLLLAGIFLSFSRGAWGQFAFAVLVMMALTFITSRSPNERLRILVIALLGALALVAFVAALLSIDKVANLFQQRAAFEQSYDVGHTGRFGRHLLGFLMALDHPLGVGPLQFRNFFPEDPHNAYLNAFMSGGWLSGFTYLTLTVVTLVLGLRHVFVRTPWRSLYIAIYAAYVGLAAESLIIDSDHWRHYFLVVGVLWGLMAATRKYHALARLRPAA